MTTVQLSVKGRVVMPRGLRDQLNLREGDLLSIELDGELLILHKAKAEEGNWRKWRGILKGTSTLQNHEREHREKVNRVAENDQG